MKLKIGQTLASPVDGTSVVVVRCPGEDVSLTCAGAELVQPGGTATSATPVGEPGGGFLMGKRYTADALGLELLCVKPGSYPVAANGLVLEQKSAQPLPASD